MNRMQIRRPWGWIVSWAVPLTACQSAWVRNWLAVAALACALLPCARAEELKWVNLAFDLNWSSPLNWNRVRAPRDGDTLVFYRTNLPNAMLASRNDMPGLVLESIEASNPVQITGEVVTLANSLSVYNENASSVGLGIKAQSDISISISGAGSILSSAIHLNGHAVSIGGSVDFSGSVSGNGTLVVHDARFVGNAANVYTGTTRILGSCKSERTTGPVLLGDLDIAGTLELLASSQIQGNNRLAVSGLLKLGPHGVTVASLALDEGRIESTTGTIELQGGITNHGASEILANLNLSADVHSLSVSNDSLLTIQGDVTGPAGSITKAGAGACVLKNGHNTYGGLTTVNEGRLVFDHGEPGDDGIATIVNGAGQLVLSNAVVSSEPLTIQTTHDPTTTGALVGQGISEWNGSITLNQSAALEGAGELRVSGRITGPGDLHLIGHTIRLGGMNATNNYTGQAWVRATNVVLQGGGPTRVLLPGVVEVLTNATLRLNGHDQFTHLTTLKIADGGTLDMDGFNGTLNDLRLAGKAFTDAGVLSLAGTVSTPANQHGFLHGNVALIGDVEFTPRGEAVLEIHAAVRGGGNLRKTGQGRLRLFGVNTYSGPTHLLDGETELISGATLGSGGGGVLLGATLKLNTGLELGEALTTVSDSIIQLSAGTNLWLGPVTNDHHCTLVVGPAAQLIFGSPVNGSGVFLGGSNHLGRTSLATPGTNKFDGTFELLAGQLYLNASNAPALGAGASLRLRNSAVCRLQSEEQLAKSTHVELHDTSLLDLNNYSSAVGHLLLNGGDITTGQGSLQLADDVTRTDTGGNTSSITGHVLLMNGPHTFTVANGGVIQIDAAMGGNPGLLKSGPGFLTLAGSNSFNGPLTIHEGLVFASDPAALGTTNGQTIVEGTGVLELWGGHDFGDEAIQLDSSGNGAFPALVSGGGNNRLSGSVALVSSTSVKVFPSTILRLDGPINGAGGLAKLDAGILHLAGSAPNTFSGGLVVGAGALQLAKNVANAAVLGNITVGDRSSTATLFLSGGEQIADTANVTLDSNGTLNMTSSTGGERISRLQGSGHIVLGEQALRVMNGALASTFSGDISGTGGLVKEGTARLRLTGTNTYTGPTDINAGSLQISGSLLSSPIRVNSGGTLGGKGIVGQVTAFNGGTVAPGESPGALTVASNLIFRTGSRLVVELDGPAAGTDFDQIVARAGVSIAEAQLAVALHFTPTNGQRFRLIDKISAGLMSGTFVDLPEGGSFTNNGVGFAASYATGTGNDFALAVTSVPATEPTVIPLVFTSVTKLDNGNLKLEGTGQTNQPIVIEFSDDFVDWTELGTRPVGDGTFSIQDSAPQSPRFYRARRW